MDVKLRERDGVTIAGLGGKLAAGVGDRQLHDLLDELLAENRKRILLDLSGVTGIDSSGVGELVAGLRVARKLGAELKILQAPERVHHILSLTQVLPLFEVYEDENEAVAAFGAPEATGGAAS
ncbi:MAG TPA: STAS domain-containing protein [Thermoanaerobaculia bacterium]|nr:STAS domain-containing protein [Thermoanaerobaculia bacterium]